MIGAPGDEIELTPVTRGAVVTVGIGMDDDVRGVGNRKGTPEMNLES